jgi:CheY-like chemotaxis protein
MMNGSLTMISEPGQGSTFTLKINKIPIVNDHSNMVEKQNIADALEIVFTGGTILVADDEILNRNLIKVCFEKTPVKVLEAENGIDAYNIAKVAKPDVILMDMKMPFLSGYEASLKIKEDSEIKDIPILAFSASSLFLEKDEPDKQLFAGYVSKPVGLNDLYDEMAKYLPHHKSD